MDSNIKKENERMKQQLDGFRKIHELQRSRGVSWFAAISEVFQWPGRQLFL
jgi:hypothetical protein